MRTIFLGRKPYSCRALEYLLKKNIEVVGVVTLSEKTDVHWTPRLTETATQNNIPLYSDKELYNAINTGQLGDIDLVISYLYWKKIKKELIRLPRIGCINFHPAPLPELRGLAGYNIAILEQMDYYGVSAHFVNNQIDTGDLIKVRRFNIDPEKETAYSLEKKTQKEMFELFKEIITIAIEQNSLTGTPQGKGRYINRDLFEKMRMINPEDSAELIARKIRAFWYPPQHGACITLNEQEYTLVNKELLEEIAKYYHH